MKDDLQKKRKRESIPLKKPSNSDQYSHGLAVLDNLEEAVDALENEDIDKAKKLLNEDKDIVNKRLKLVQLADREDWLVVNEFRTDELAETPEEERRIKKAKKSATLKRGKFRKEKEISRNFSRNNSPASATAVYSNQYSRPDSMPGYTSQRYKRSYDNVVCFQCGRLGHYRSFSPDNNKTHTVQISNVQGQR